MIRRLSEEESLTLLRGKRIGRLGCIAGGSPYVVPVSYAFDGGFIISHTLPGRKLTAMREHPRVCVQVDEIEDFCRWRSVIAYGTFEEVTEHNERANSLNCLFTLFPQLTPVESRIAEDAGAPTPVVFRIRIQSITGICEA